MDEIEALMGPGCPGFDPALEAVVFVADCSVAFVEGVIDIILIGSAVFCREYEGFRKEGAEEISEDMRMCLVVAGGQADGFVGLRSLRQFPLTGSGFEDFLFRRVKRQEDIADPDGKGWGRGGVDFGAGQGLGSAGCRKQKNERKKTGWGTALKGFVSCPPEPKTNNLRTGWPPGRRPYSDSWKKRGVYGWVLVDCWAACSRVTLTSGLEITT